MRNVRKHYGICSDTLASRQGKLEMIGDKVKPRRYIPFFIVVYSSIKTTASICCPIRKDVSMQSTLYAGTFLFALTATLFNAHRNAVWKLK